MQKERGRNNAGSLFGVHQIPSTQQIGNLLDPIAPAHLDAGFMTLAEAMHPHGVLKTPRQTDGRRLIALDGTEYHSSCAISCPPCSTRTLSYDKRQFYHMAVTPVLVAQGQADVFPSLPLT